jgi:uncharacterized protein (DUF433 family)/DNA-binding transcriptional MerR regulator
MALDAEASAPAQSCEGGEQLFAKLIRMSRRDDFPVRGRPAANLPGALGVGSAEVVRPVGWYLAIDVAELAGVSYRSIVQWAKHGYVEAHRDPGPPHVFSYQDVAEAMVVHELLDRNVRRSEIRTAVGNMRQEYGDWPLQAAPIAVYEDRDHGNRLRSRMALKQGADVFDVGGAGGRQTYLQYQELTELASLLRRGGWVIRKNPKIRHIEVNPNVLSGKPTIRGHRLAVRQVVAIAREKGGPKELREGYDLTTAEIRDALAWADAVEAFAAAA